MLRLSVAAVAYWLLFGALHELAHLIAAYTIGCGRDVFSSQTLADAMLRRRVDIAVGDARGWRAQLVRAAGWVASVTLAAACCRGVVGSAAGVRLLGFGLFGAKGDDKDDDWRQPSVVRAAVALLTAAEAVWTDLLGGEPSSSSARAKRHRGSRRPEDVFTTFFCGNFGMVVLSQLWLQDGGTEAKKILQKMIQVTMMRGAQSGGVVTFLTNGTLDASGGMYVATRLLLSLLSSLFSSSRRLHVKNVTPPSSGPSVKQRARASCAY